MTVYSVTSGHTSTSLTLNSGDALYVLAGGSASAITVSNGGFEVVSSGGSAVSNSVIGGGTLVVLPGGSATATTGTEVSTGVVVHPARRGRHGLRQRGL